MLDATARNRSLLLELDPAYRWVARTIDVVLAMVIVALGRVRGARRFNSAYRKLRASDGLASARVLGIVS